MAAGFRRQERRAVPAGLVHAPKFLAAAHRPSRVIAAMSVPLKRAKLLAASVAERGDLPIT